MNLQQLRYVRALVEEGSFVSAAAQCSVTQPTLSNGIAQLEAELGQRIFRRTTRSLSLTPVGERLLPAVIETLKSFDKIKDLAAQAGPANSSIHVGISPVVGISRAQTTLEVFQHNRPGVELVFREANLQSLSDALKAGELDLILAPMDADCAILTGYVYRKLCSEPLLFLPKLIDRHRWKGRISVAIEDVADETFVLVPNLCGLTQVTRKLFERASLVLRRYPGEASNYSVVQEWATLGLGAALLPASKLASTPDADSALSLTYQGEPVLIDYYALGKPNTVLPELFFELWEGLRPFDIKEACVPSSEGDYVLDWAV
ncbi:MAG: LysR family transcriptional regulator [Proteobacteria bacterium]|nr:LysR family transcriptional regulator [Pseudomonadota bacterium]